METLLRTKLFEVRLFRVNLIIIILQMILLIYFIGVAIKYWNKKNIHQHVFKITIFVLLVEFTSSVIIGVLDILRLI